MANKVSQSITIVGHLFHCDYSTKATLDNRVVNRIKEEVLLR